VIAFKFLRGGGRTLFSRKIWPLPTGASPGAWLEAAEGPLKPCRNGVHACEVVDLPYWTADELWEIELEGEQFRGPDAVIARRGRLLRAVAGWTAAAKAEYANACAQRIETRLGSIEGPLPTRASGFAEQARTLAGAGYWVAASYAAALAFATLAMPEAELAAFRAERKEQALVLGRILGL
jgi:hypothetical protein